MSLDALIYYFDSSPLQSTDKLAMLILADFADEHGYAYPGHARIAHRLNISIDGARKTLYRLRDLGEIEITQSKGVHTPTGSTNRYRLTKYADAKKSGWNRSQINCKGCDPSTTLAPEDTVKGVTPVPPLDAQGCDPSTTLDAQGWYPSTTDPLDINTNNNSARAIATSRGDVATIEQNSNAAPVSAKRNKARTRAVVANDAPPPTAGATPPKRTRQRKTRNPQLADALWAAYVDAMTAHEPGAVLNIAAEKKAINQLADAGTWSADHLRQCIDQMKAQPFWKGQHLAVASIAKQIAAVLNGKVMIQPAGNHRTAKPSMESWLMDRYGMDNLDVIAITNNLSRQQIELEYQLAA